MGNLPCMSILPAFSSNYLVFLWHLCQINIIPPNLTYLWIILYHYLLEKSSTLLKLFLLNSESSRMTSCSLCYYHGSIIITLLFSWFPSTKVPTASYLLSSWRIFLAQIYANSFIIIYTATVCKQCPKTHCHSFRYFTEVRKVCIRCQSCWVITRPFTSGFTGPFTRPFTKSTVGSLVFSFFPISGSMMFKSKQEHFREMKFCFSNCSSKALEMSLGHYHRM